MKRSGRILAIVAALVVIGGIALLLWPKPKDPLCEYVNASKLECLALVADEQTYRPGAITRLTPDAKDRSVRRVELPLSYLDNESCIIPGASLTALSPRPQPFTLRSVKYSMDSAARLSGNLAQGLEVKVGPASKRVQQIELSFGNAHTELLDQNMLLSRINSCAIRKQCIDQIVAQGYRVINRVLEVDEIDYDFKDEKGGSISIDTLEKEHAIQLGGTFELNTRSGEGLKSKQPSIIAVNLIDDAVIRSATPCQLDVQYFREGNAEVAIGGGGGQGHVTETLAPQHANFGQTASLSQRGSESAYGNFDQTQSSAAATALVDKADADNAIRLVLTIASHGGHYGRRGPLGIGIISGADTSANASAQVAGRINILLRRPAARLHLAWVGFPDSHEGGGTAISGIIVASPGGGEIKRLDVSTHEGQQDLSLQSEGQYAVIATISLRAETNGSAGIASRSVDALVTATASIE